jgi:hypothetical protein
LVIPVKREQELQRGTRDWTAVRDIRQYDVGPLGERRLRADERIFESHGYFLDQRLTAPDDPLVTVIFRRREHLQAAGGGTPKRQARKAPKPTIAVLAMSADQGLTLGFRCTAAEFKRLFRAYTDQADVLLAEARAWPMSRRIFGGEVFAHGLDAAPGEKPWRTGSRMEQRVTLIKASEFVGLKPTYRIMTRTAFITAVATWLAEPAAWFDWMVENRGWRTDTFTTAYGAPLVWVEGDERASVVDQLVRLRDVRTDVIVEPLTYDGWQKNLLLALVDQLPASGPATVEVGAGNQWPMRSLLGLGDEVASANLTAGQVEALRNLATRIRVNQDLDIPPEDLRRLRLTTECGDCGTPLQRGDAMWYYSWPRCVPCESAEAPVRAARQQEQAAAWDERLRDSAERAAMASRERMAQAALRRSGGVGTGAVLGFLIGREIGRRD